MDTKLEPAPNVFIVGRQIIDRAELRAFLESQESGDWQSDSEIPAQELVEVAGRLCYNSFSRPRPGGNKTYLEHIIHQAHGSCLEHAVWNFIITGVSRSLSHEFIRHRAGVGISQASQRYINESEALFIIPDEINEDEALVASTNAHFQKCREIYDLIAESILQRLKNERGNKNIDHGIDDDTTLRKMARQTARAVLPNATETKIFWTANARAIRNVIEQRGSRYADKEIRRLSNVLYEKMMIEAPNIFADYTKIPLGDGTYELTTPNRKV